ncbi:DUF6273 domain-containing protein [Tyzzerella sp. OttesenSCG-928-J15]|nr:DUF6273 domain-containing protein [Tyzzerella sp. OttesenSCG-928-J15]
MEIGEKITFDKFEWRVLDIQNGAALIITEYIIDQRPYHKIYENITWAKCSLREYLNGEFYNNFTHENQLKIVPVINKNPNNQWYNTDGGEDTSDKIFLLDMEEVACKYFGDSSQKLHNPGKNQRYWFERKDENNRKRSAWLADDKGNWWWWLRSPGRVGVKAVYIHGDGNIGIQGNNILKGNLSDGRCTGGVRPALWVKI